MKKSINGKSYNTEYDSEFICKYTSVIDSWSHSVIRIFRKKSTGEYFRYERWSSWNDGWDIALISEEKAQDIIKNVKAGLIFHYTALYSGTRTLRKGYSMWGTEDDNPWDKKAAKKRAEEAKAKKEAKVKKAEEKKAEAKADTEWSSTHCGILEITKVEEGHKYSKYNKKSIKNDVSFHRLTARIVNSDKNEKGSKNTGWYKYGFWVAMPGTGNKKDAKDLILGLIDDVKKEYGEFDAIMKDGSFISPEKNKQMMSKVYDELDKWNEGVCF